MASVADKVVYTTGAVAIKVTMITDSRLSNVKLDRALTSLNDTLVRLEETRAGVNGKVHLLSELAFLLNDDAHEIVAMGASLDEALSGADVIIISLGINDVKAMAIGGKFENVVETHLRNCALVIAALRRKGHHCPIMFVHPLQVNDPVRGWVNTNRLLGKIADEIGMLNDHFYNRRVVFVRVPFKFPEGLEKDRLHLTDNAKMQIMSALSEAAADIRGYFSGKPGSMRGVQHVLAGCEVEAKAAKRTSDTAKESACAVPVPSKRQAVAGGAYSGGAVGMGGSKVTAKWRAPAQVEDDCMQYSQDSLFVDQDAKTICSSAGDYSTAGGTAQRYQASYSQPPVHIAGGDVPQFLHQLAAGVNSLKIDRQ